VSTPALRKPWVPPKERLEQVAKDILAHHTRGRVWTQASAVAATGHGPYLCIRALALLRRRNQITPIKHGPPKKPIAWYEQQVLAAHPRDRHWTLPELAGSLRGDPHRYAVALENLRRKRLIPRPPTGPRSVDQASAAHLDRSPRHEQRLAIARRMAAVQAEKLRLQGDLS
jgi:hypothetical protein